MNGKPFFDTNIVLYAAALDARSTTLHTEDMQSGQKISGLTILNPF
jgi:predicted nucleic acid-binding protein